MSRACVFSTDFIREEVDPRVQEAWREAYRTAAPFAKLRQMWKTQHCVQVDPYNTGCPYATEDCAMAFLVAVERTTGFHPERPTGYFRAVAHSMGLDRADNKPLSRDIVSRMDVRKEGQPADSGDGSEEGRVLHRPVNRPVRIGELLGALDLRPHQGPTKDSQEGNK